MLERETAKMLVHLSQFTGAELAYNVALWERLTNEAIIEWEGVKKRTPSQTEYRHSLATIDGMIKRLEILQDIDLSVEV